MTTPSTHDVYREYVETTGSQEFYLNDRFVETMTAADMKKITLQLVKHAADAVSVFDSDSYRRTLEDIEYRKVFGS